MKKRDYVYPNAMNAVSTIVASEIEYLREEQKNLDRRTQPIRNGVVLCFGDLIGCPDFDVVRSTYVPLLHDIQDFLDRLVLLHVQSVNAETRTLINAALPDFQAIRKDLQHCAIMIRGWKDIYSDDDRENNDAEPPIDSIPPFGARQKTYDVSS